MDNNFEFDFCSARYKREMSLIDRIKAKQLRSAYEGRQHFIHGFAEISEWFERYSNLGSYKINAEKI
jgi:hypothetical protein